MKRSAPGVLWILAILAGGCDRTNNDPGFDYFPDMFYSHAYETYTPNGVFADSLTLRDPVRGTIPVGFIPYTYEKNDTDRLLAGRELINPIQEDSSVLARGKFAYGIYCAGCHGSLGDGKGHLYQSGLYNYPPASLINEKISNAPDGEIYHVITVGHGVMMAHGGIIRPDDRWKIVHFVRKLQRDAKNSGAKN